MAMDHAKVASEVLDALGGADNINAAAHCATRLRLVINDDGKINQKAVVKLGNAHIGESGGNVHQHSFALFQCVGGLLVGIGADGHDQFVKHGLCVADHP